MAYGTYLFDMDGTLLDTLADLADAINHILKQYGYAPCTVEQARQRLGNGARKLIAAMLPQGEETPGFEALLQAYKDYYQAHACIKTVPYPGIPEMLETLRQRGCRIAIVSNKPDGATRELAARFFPGLPAFGQQDGIPAKPAPDMVYHALAELGVDRADAAYVGDSEVDVALAKNAGLPLIAVSWGFRGRRALEEAGAELVVDDAAQLLENVL